MPYFEMYELLNYQYFLCVKTIAVTVCILKCNDFSLHHFLCSFNISVLKTDASFFTFIGNIFCALNC